VLVQRPLLLGW